MGGGMVRMLERAGLGLVVAALLVYGGDWTLWRVRAAHGSAVSHVRVSRVVVAPLKGNREEFYPDGTAEVQCSRSMFPWGGDAACWWVERHRTVVE